MKQLPVRVKVERIGYLRDDNHVDKREWILPSAFKGDTVVVTEYKTGKLSISYLSNGEWDLNN